MRNLFFKILVFVMLPVFGLQAQDYSDGIDNLMEVKYVSEDVARAIKFEWDHNSSKYKEAQKLYNATKSSVEQMIAAFDAKIRAGYKISNEEISFYVKKASDNSMSLVKYYNDNSVAGGTNALFGIKNLVSIFGEIFDGIKHVINEVKQFQIEMRLNKMHKALDPCKLVAWDTV
ncbi:MAG: hypothetical protein R3A50_09945 [Saprospiraceae bacterium]